jgi:hypothetical protein
MSDTILIAIITTVVGGFISIISLLLKYRLDNNKTLSEIKNISNGIKSHDANQDLLITKISDSLNETNATLGRFCTQSDFNDKVLYKFMDMQYSMDKIIYKDIKNEEHNGDLDTAKANISGFYNILSSDEFKKMSGGLGVSNNDKDEHIN